MQWLLKHFSMETWWWTSHCHVAFSLPCLVKCMCQFGSTHYVYSKVTHTVMSQRSTKVNSCIFVNVRHLKTMLWSLQGMKQWERKVRSASSLDELLMHTDFPDWKLWKCRLRLQQPESQTESQSESHTETLSSPPLAGSHRSTRYAAESYSLEILKGWIKHKQKFVHVFIYEVMNILCLSLSHRWRVATDSVHPQGNVCWCGQGIRHWPLNVLQATLCICP